MKREGGFTLLEMLVVISLMGLLLTLVSTALVAGNRAVNDAERHSEAFDDIRAAHRFLRQSLSQTLPLSGRDSDDQQEAPFQGQREAMVFYAPLTTALGGGLYRQQLVLEDHRLQVHLSRLEGQRLVPWGAPQTLLEGVQTLQFRYRGRSPLGEPTGWLDHWPWPMRLPMAVRVDMTLDSGRVWVSQQIALRLDLSGDTGS